MTPPVRAAVFASGSGTNLQALLDHETADGLYHIVVVISDREGAGALGRAEAATKGLTLDTQRQGKASDQAAAGNRRLSATLSEVTRELQREASESKQSAAALSALEGASGRAAAGAALHTQALETV